MSSKRYQQHHGKRLLGFGLIALVLLAALLSLVYFLLPDDERYIQMQVGDQEKITDLGPVQGVKVDKPKVVRAEWEKDGSMVLIGRHRGLAKVVIRRTRGRDRIYHVEVGHFRPIAVALAPRKRATSNWKKPMPIKKKKPKPPRKEDRPKGQVVEIARPVVEKRPTKSKYLSEYDSMVSKETRSRYRKPIPKPKGVKLKVPSKPKLSLPQPLLKPKRRSRISLRTPKFPEAYHGLQPRPRFARPHQKLQLMPTAEAVASVTGGHVNDYLPGVKQGEDTFLNTKRWRYASFFNRVKRVVSQHWRPDIIYRRRDPYGNVYGPRDRLTVLHITLKKDGSLEQVRVRHRCGLDFLDSEAISAFQRSAPFPNPPKGLVDPSGRINFSFGFSFLISANPSFKLFRWQ